MAIKVGTNKPSGLKIKRNGLTFTFSWKKGQTYGDGQQLQYKLYEAPSQELAANARNFLSQGFEIDGFKWTPITITKTATSKDLTISASDYYPTVENRLYGIAFRVKGRASNYTKNGKTYDPQWSAWTYKTIVIKPPKASEVTESWDSGIVARSTYTWTTESDSANKYPVTNTEYQAVVKQDCPEDITGLEEWDAAVPSTGTLNSSTYYNETNLTGVSKTRVFRIRARGIGGYSSWAYAKHVFAAPLAAQITENTAEYESSSSVWNLSAKWSTPQDAGHPVDFYTLQYRLGKPGASMAVTSDNAWTDLGQTSTGDLFAQVTDTLSDDECLWLRVAASHDNHTGANAVTGTPVRAYTGVVAAPTSLSITAYDISTQEISVSVKNNSAITDSKVAIVFQPSTNPNNSVIVDVLTGSGTLTKSGIKCPDWSSTGTLGLKAYAYVGSENYVTDSDSIKKYNIIPVMMSDYVFTSGNIPKAPATVTAVKNGQDIEVNWSWTWDEANKAEVSWSTKENAWNSTDEPSTFEVSSTGSAHLFISDIDLGELYYVRVRLIYDDGDTVTYSPYSKTVPVYMTEAPQVPILDLSSDTVKEGEDLTCSWTYVSQDGTPQAYAKIDEIISGVATKIAETVTAQHITFTSEWTPGTQHELVLTVMSASGLSAESESVIVTAVAKPTCTITQSSLTAGGGGYVLNALPLTVTVTGAGEAGQTVLSIVRADDFVQRMPDDSLFNGFADEVVTRRLYSGEAQQTITLDDINPGTLNDTADYKIVAVVTDGYGQTDDDAVDFTVAWSTQPVAPEAAVTLNDTAAYITLTKPAGASNTDTVDIYRMSVDGFELIYKDAAFTDVVVDPYPAIGEYGGYRVVLKTKNGDFYDTEQKPTWGDYDAGFESDYQYIDFNGHTLPLALNVNLESGWAKDFKKTKYLGGHEEGDWLAGVERTGSVASVLITEQDTDDIKTLRQLAMFSGIAQIRTKDGSSYAANIDVTNVNIGYEHAGKYTTLSLAIQAIKRTHLDGLLQAQWEA